MLPLIDAFLNDLETHRSNGASITTLSYVRSKLKCPVFLAHEMSGFEFNQQPSWRWQSGNPAWFAGFPSEVGKSAFGLFHGASFPRPLPAA
jgi:hypothetical protein